MKKRATLLTFDMACTNAKLTPTQIAMFTEWAQNVNGYDVQDFLDMSVGEIEGMIVQAEKEDAFSSVL